MVYLHYNPRSGNFSIKEEDSADIGILVYSSPIELATSPLGYHPLWELYSQLTGELPKREKIVDRLAFCKVLYQLSKESAACAQKGETKMVAKKSPARTAADILPEADFSPAPAPKGRGRKAAPEPVLAPAPTPKGPKMPRKVAPDPVELEAPELEAKKSTYNPDSFAQGAIANDDVIKPVRDANPRRAGTAGWDSYNILLDGGAMTVAEYVEKGGRRNDLRWDIAHGYVELTAGEDVVEEEEAPAPKKRGRKAA